MSATLKVKPSLFKSLGKHDGFIESSKCSKVRAGRRLDKINWAAFLESRCPSRTEFVAGLICRLLAGTILTTADEQNSKPVQIDLTISHLQVSHASRHRCAHQKKWRSSAIKLPALHVDLADAVA